MKRILKFLVSITMIFTLTACTVVKTINNTMYIQKAELTKEEQSLIELIGEEKVPYILDFAVDDTIESLQMNIYELENGQWKMISGDKRLLDEKNGRIALSFDNIGLGMRVVMEGQGSNSYKIDPDFNFEGLGTATTYLTNKQTIECENEIPLVIQVHTSKDNISCLSPEYGFYELQEYEDLDYEKVYAITCIFSRKNVNELLASSDR